MGRTSDAKDRLLESARSLISERGYTAVGVADICQCAQVQKGSFYHFFPSKQQLVLDLVDQHWREARAFLESTLMGSDPPLVRFERYCQSFYQHSHESFKSEGRLKGCPLGNLATEMSTQDDLLRARLQQTFEAHIGYLERLLREAKTAGDLPEAIDPHAAAEAVFALAEGKIMLAKTRNDPETLKDFPALAKRQIGL